MAGFPVPQLDRHLKTLVQVHGRSVAMCEEFRKSGQTEKFLRRVARILTPGTLIDEPFLNPFENNYLLAISTGNATESLGLAWIDVSTGEFFSETTQLRSLRDDLARIKPSEVVLHSDAQSSPNDAVAEILRDESCRTNFARPSEAHLIQRHSRCTAGTDDITNEGTDCAFSEEEDRAISLLTNFLETHLLDHMPTISRPARLERGSRLLIDAQTIRALEIKEGMNGGGLTGSLLGTIKRTVTQSGTRLLSRWICGHQFNQTELQFTFFRFPQHLRS